MVDNLKFKIENLKLEWYLFFFSFVILVLFFFLRLTNLTIVPIFADEAIYIRWAQVMKAEPTLRFLPLSDGKQPLFMWLLMPVLKLFQDPLVAGRMISVLAGLGTLVGLGLLTYWLFRSKKITLLAAFLYAISPFAVFFDRLALVDALLCLLGVWTLFLGVLLVQYRRLDLAMTTGIVLGLALITKSPATFFAILLPTTILLLLSQKQLISGEARCRSTGQIIKLIALWAVVYLFAYGIYNLLRLGPNFSLIGSRNQDYIFSLREVLSHPQDPFMPHLPQVWQWFLFYLTWPVMVLGLVGLILGLKKFPRQTLLLFLWFSLPLLAQMAVAKVFTARYLYFVIPYFLVLAAYSLETIINFVNERRFTNNILIYCYLATSIVLLSFSFFSLKNDWNLLTNPQKAALPEDERNGYLQEWTSGYGINEVRDYLRSLPKNKHVNVGTEGYFGTLPDGLLIYFDKDPNVTVFGVGLNFSRVPPELLESASKGNPTYLVVNNSRMGEARLDSALTLVMSVPKAQGKKGQDSLLLYQVQ